MSVDSHLLPVDVRVVEVVHVRAARGDGSNSSPVRVVDLYYDKAGVLLACHDPVNGPVDYFYARPGEAA